MTGLTPITIGMTPEPAGMTPVAISVLHPSDARRGRSAPGAHNRTARPTIGSTSPRDPYVANTTRISLLTFP